MNPERRRFVRKRIEKLTYIHLEGNGAIILDASEHGLGFHAAGPTQGIGPMRFHVSLDGRRRLEVCGEVIWTDAGRKTGGLRFVDPVENSGELRTWLGRLLGEPISAGASVLVEAASASDAAASSVPASSAAVSLTPAAPAEVVEADRDEKSGAEAIAATAAASVVPPTVCADISKKAGAKTGGNLPAPQQQRLSATGIGFLAFAWLGLLCWMGVGVFVCRHPVGRSLVQIGEWLGDSQQRGQQPGPQLELSRAISQSEHAMLNLSAALRVSDVGVLASAAAEPAGPARQASPSPQGATSSAASLTGQQLAMRQLDEEIAALEQVYADDVDPYAGRARHVYVQGLVQGAAQGAAQGGQPRGAALDAPGAREPVRDAAAVRGRENAAEEIEFKTGAPTRGASALLGNVSQSPANRSGEAWFNGRYGPEKISANPTPPLSPGTELAPRTTTGSSSAPPARVSPAQENADSINDTYLDVGSYKEWSQADTAAGDLNRRGFQTMVVRRRLLWMQAFHVIIGPYKNDEEADAARGTLEPMGLRPRSAGAPRESVGTAFNIPH